jgi:hypothetical protein
MERLKLKKSGCQSHIAHSGTYPPTTPKAINHLNLSYRIRPTFFTCSKTLRSSSQRGWLSQSTAAFSTFFPSSVIVEDAFDVVDSSSGIVLSTEDVSFPSRDSFGLQGEPGGVLERLSFESSVGSVVRFGGDLLPTEGEVGGVGVGEKERCGGGAVSVWIRRERRSCRMKGVGCIFFLGKQEK